MTDPERTAVVTGAGSERGIGRAVARRLMAAGWAIALVDRDVEGIERGREALGEAGPAVGAYAVDLRDAAGVEEIASKIETELPPIGALINIAGVSDPTPFFELSAEQWRRVVDINLTGAFLITQRLARGMAKRGFGRIVCLGSTAAQSGGGNYSTTAYAASKAGIEGLVRGLARELAPSGVTVNCIAPALIDTDIMGGPITADRRPGFVAAVPLGRLGRTDEVAALVEFLIGPDGGFITGATYNLNGGVRIG